ncbi:hypothetical protein ACIQ7D_17650 [Streptomyces sp. NPDC096310]|uniref:hypothetical protein n=1 Tax=Streptomyces sp. NPDC096310 TaxID=3366082 RepID=UPI0038032913
MNAATRLCYQRIPSFKREFGGLYRLYAEIYSRAYAACMRHLHRHGRHAAEPGISNRCSWCGATPAS